MRRWPRGVPGGNVLRWSSKRANPRCQSTVPAHWWALPTAREAGRPAIYPATINVATTRLWLNDSVH